MKKYLLILLLLLTACRQVPEGSGASAPEAEPSTLRVQYTAAARPWLAALQDCAPGQAATLLLEPRSSDFFDPNIDLAMRIGGPAVFSGPAYQIGEEEIVLVVHPQNPVALLDQEAARRLFAGQVANWQELGGPDLTVQVWVFAASEDVQQAFDAAILQGTPAASTARLATSLEAMAAGVGSDPAAVGLLPASQVPETVRGLHLEEPIRVPVLVLANAEPDGALAEILACLQDQ
jgi:hypothetical protein